MKMQKAKWTNAFYVSNLLAHESLHAELSALSYQHSGDRQASVRILFKSSIMMKYSGRQMLVEFKLK